MPGLRFAITQQQKSVLTGSIYGLLTWVLAGLAVLDKYQQRTDSIEGSQDLFAVPRQCSWTEWDAMPV